MISPVVLKEENELKERCWTIILVDVGERFFKIVPPGYVRRPAVRCPRHEQLQTCLKIYVISLSMDYLFSNFTGAQYSARSSLYV